MRYRQWEFLPRRVVLIDGQQSPLEPGQYALEFASLVLAKGLPTLRTSRYRFELRPRTHG